MAGMGAGISAIIITKDEEKDIKACLESLKWVDEIIIVDCFSTDKTAYIARQYTDKIFIREWPGYGRQRNFAISQCSKDWILWVDADERVSPALKEAIEKALCRDSVFDGYLIPLKSYFLNKWIRYCGWYPGHAVRLFKRGSAQFDESPVHEHLDFKGRVGFLKNDLLHFSYATITDYLEKMNIYTTLQAQEFYEKKINIKGKKWLVTFVVQFFRVFKKMYFNQKGYKDGLHGFLLCFLSAVSRLIAYAKYWELITDSGSRDNSIT